MKLILQIRIWGEWWATSRLNELSEAHFKQLLSYLDYNKDNVNVVINKMEDIELRGVAYNFLCL